jgi:hypothetical protein
MRIDRRFNGPPASGNGGVSCGLLAAYLDAPVVEVTLRQPPPLGVDLAVKDGELYDGDLLVATARPGSVELDPPRAVSVEEAAAAESRYAGLVDHPSRCASSAAPIGCRRTASDSGRDASPRVSLRRAGPLSRQTPSWSGPHSTARVAGRRSNPAARWSSAG